MGYTSKKQLISDLNEKYPFVHKWEDGFCLYDVIDVNKNYNKFIAFINIDKGKYIFQDKKYNNVEDLSKSIDEYVNTLPFDSDIYNPTYRKHVPVERVCHEYLIKLGFVYQGGDNYVYKDRVTNKVMFNIEVDVDDDTTTGRIIKTISDFRWSEQKFENIESALASINSTLVCDTLSVAAQSVQILKSMGDTRNYKGMKEKTLNMSTLSTYTKDMKDGLISMLEKELEILKNS